MALSYERPAVGSDGQRHGRPRPGRRPAELYTQLQRSAGNRAVADLVTRRAGIGRAGGRAGRPLPPPSARHDRVLLQRSVEATESQDWMRSLFHRATGVPVDELGARTLIALGVRREDELTNMLFWLRRPEAAFRRIRPDEPELAQEWVAIRDTVVRPVLGRAATAKAPGPRGAERPDEPGVAGGTGGTPGIIRADQLGDYRKDEEKSRFRREVYAAQLDRALKDPEKTFVPNLPAGELEEVEGGFMLHRSAAGKARELLDAARSDLKAAQARGVKAAADVEYIRIKSAYRSLQDDFAAWKSAFETHYGNTQDQRGKLPGGPHGAQAVTELVDILVGWKAVPGFSNHTRGRAVDFTTKQGEWVFKASSAQKAGWVNTWLYDWLSRNAATHDFRPYEKEPWHWDHAG